MTHLTCYRCEELKFSVDHVPPKGLFPEGYRDNLKTVPSCSKHNEKQSYDDLVLIYLLSILAFPKNAPYKIISTQILNRASLNFDRKLNSIVNMMSDITPVLAHDTRTNTYFETAQFNLIKVQNHLDRALKKIAYGVYFLKYKKPLFLQEEKLFSHIDISIKQSSEDEKIIHSLYENTHDIFEMHNIPFENSRYEVFQYRVLEIEESDFIGFEFIFYEVIKATVTNIRNSEEH